MSIAGAAPEDRQLTIEEFERLPEDRRYKVELVRGRLVREPLPGPRHGRITIKLGAHINQFAETHDLGLAFTETGFALYRDPDTVRGPDLSFVSKRRLPPSGYTGTFWRLAPDLAVEILSPSNRPRETLEKVNEYLDAGSRLVWVVDPERRTATVFGPGAKPRHLDAAGMLDGGEVLPGFSLSLAKLFGTP